MSDLSVRLPSVAPHLVKVAFGNYDGLLPAAALAGAISNCLFMAVVDDVGFREPMLAKAATRVSRDPADAMVNWAHILKALAGSDVAGDRELAQRLSKFVCCTSVYKDCRPRQPDHEPSIAQEPGTTWVHEASKRNPDNGVER